MTELVSARFFDSAELQSCANDDSAHLTAGSNGPAVALVQDALIDLGADLGVAGADGVYGQDTATAVRTYKTERDIRNAQGVIDDVVGKKTIAALDAEIDALDADRAQCGALEPVGSISPTPPEEIEPAINGVLGLLGLGTIVSAGGDGSVASRRDFSGEPDTQQAMVAIATAAAGLLTDDAEPHRAAALAAAPALAASPQITATEGPGFFEGLLAAAQNFAAGTAQITGLLAQAGSPGTPIRDLDKASALAFVALAHAQGQLEMVPAPVLDAAGKVISPTPETRITIKPTVAGVTFKNVGFADRTHKPTGFQPYNPVTVNLTAIDVRHAEGLRRLANRMATSFGATEIHHAGVGGGNPQGENHGQGRAIDLVGVKGNTQGRDYLVTVLNDWAKHTVPNRANPAKQRLPDWPHVTGTLEYRLDTAPAADALARDIFRDLYAFAIAEYQDKTDGPKQALPASKIGEGSNVMTPDHPTSDTRIIGGKISPHGREAHIGHMHFQVGPVGFQAAKLP